jgi:hypothetical protein
MYEVILYGAVLTVEGDYDKGSSRCNSLDEEQGHSFETHTVLAQETDITEIVMIAGELQTIDALVLDKYFD